MYKKFIWVVASGLVVVAMLLSACAPAAPAAPKATAPSAPVVKEATPAASAAPAGKETTPAGKEAAPVEEQPRYGGKFTFSYSAPILAWDEAYQSPWTLQPNLAPIYEELVTGDWTRGPAGTNETTWGTSAWFDVKYIVGALAESWEVPDMQTLIFHIRKGVRWQNKLPVNGREFTADDAVFNIKRIYIDIPTSTMYGMAGVSRPTEVYATDKYTVVVKTPSGQAGMTLEAVGDMTRMVPPEVVQKYGDINTWENALGTGPFMLVDYVPMSSATFVKNPNYWYKSEVGPGKGDQLPYLDEVKLLIIPDQSTRDSALRTGKLDWTYNALEMEDAKSLLKTRPELNYMKAFNGTFGNLAIRVDKPDLPFKDIRVRRALLMVIDSEDIKASIYKGEAEILTYKIAPVQELRECYTPLDKLPLSADGFDNRKLYLTKSIGMTQEQKVAEAKKLLAAAGYPNGFKTEIVISATSAYNIDMALIAKSYWADIGVDLSLDIKDAGVYNSMYQRKTFNQMLFCGRSAHAPFQMYTVRKGNTYNTSMVDDPWIEQKYDEMTRAYFDRNKRNQLMSEINLYIIDHAWYWVPPLRYVYTIWQPWIKNYHGEQDAAIYNNTLWFRYIWIDQALKQSMGH